MPEFENLPPLTLKLLNPAQNLVEVVERIQFNFDQILLNAGGPKGDQGGEGDKGVPGATGVGKKGDQGDQGSEIFFSPSIDVSDNDDPLVITPLLTVREGDILIDSGGDYFKVFKDTFDDLRYEFKFNINTASVINPYWIDQDKYEKVPILIDGPVSEHVLFDYLDISSIERNLVVARRSGLGSGEDLSEYYRVLLGMDEYPSLNNSTLLISNILPDKSTTSASDPSSPFFAQVGFKYRDTFESILSGNTVWVIYKEEVSRNVFSVENTSVGAFWKHDTGSPDNSAFIIKGANVNFIGQSVDIFSPSEYLKTFIEEDKVTFTAQKDLTLTTDDVNGTLQVGFKSIDITVDLVTVSTQKNLTIKTNDPDGIFDVEFESILVKANSITLDKHPLFIGNNLITNGDFSAGDTDWEFVSPPTPLQWSITDKACVLRTGGFGQSLQQLGLSPLVVGNEYRVEFDMLLHDSGSLFIFAGSQSIGTVPGPNGHKVLDFIANSASTDLRFSSDFPADFCIDNIELRLITFPFVISAQKDLTVKTNDPDGTLKVEFGSIVFDRSPSSPIIVTLNQDMDIVGSEELDFQVKTIFQPSKLNVTNIIGPNGEIIDIPNRSGKLVLMDDPDDDWILFTPDVTGLNGGRVTNVANVDSKFKVIGQTLFLNVNFNFDITAGGALSFVDFLLPGSKIRDAGGGVAVTASGGDLAAREAVSMQWVVGTTVWRLIRFGTTWSADQTNFLIIGSATIAIQ